MRRILPTIGAFLASTILAGCQIPSSIAKNRGALGLPEGGTPGSSTSLSSGIVSNNAASLTGSVSSPDFGLVANNSASLSEVGVGAFYRIGAQAIANSAQGVAENPVIGATVSLFLPDGTTLAAAPVETDSQGHFAFDSITGATDSAIVQAQFTADGQAFSYQNLVTLSPARSATSSVDAESTLVASKALNLIHDGTLRLTAEAISGLHSLARALGQVWVPGQVPFMATTSQDILPTFDQLLLDNPDLSAAAEAISPSLATPTRQWNVKTVLTSRDLLDLGIYPAQYNGLKAGVFTVDGQDNLYFPTPSASGTVPIRIVQITPSHQVSTVAQLPVGLLNPVSMALSPDGKLYAIARDASGDVAVFSGLGTMAQEPGYLCKACATARSILGRIAIGLNGILYYAAPEADVIVAKTIDQNDATVLAGSPANPGYADGIGSAAQFDFPTSIALDPGNGLYVTDSKNQSIRKIIPSTQTVTTVAGRPGDSQYRTGRGAYSRFIDPCDIALGAHGSLYLTDLGSLRVERLSPQGEVFVVAGTGASGSQDGPGQDATFNSTSYLVTDGADRFFVEDIASATAGDFSIREID